MYLCTCTKLHEKNITSFLVWQIDEELTPVFLSLDIV